MGMFTRSIEAPPFGQLTTEGQSKVWEGEIDLPHLGEGFSLRIHGLKTGPTPAQITAFTHALQTTQTIKDQATPALIEFLDECDVVPSDVILTATTLWDFLEPCFLEVHPDDYLDVEQSACSIGYEIAWEQSQLIHIDLINGKFDEIHAE